MTNPLPHPGPDASLPADIVAATVQTAKTRRKAPRRATAPAGAPAKTATPALMLVDEAGMIVPSTLPAHDAGDSPKPEPAPAAEVKTSNETPQTPAAGEVAAEVVAEVVAGVSVAAKGKDDVKTAGKDKVKTEVKSVAEVAEPAAGKTNAAEKVVKKEPEATKAPSNAEVEADRAANTATKTEPAPTPAVEGKNKDKTEVKTDLKTPVETGADVAVPAAGETVVAPAAGETVVAPAAGETDPAVGDKPEATEARSDAEADAKRTADAATKTEPAVDGNDEVKTKVETEVEDETGVEVAEPASGETDAAVEDKPETADTAIHKTDSDPDVTAGSDAPAGDTETTQAHAEVAADGNPADELLHQSRRERRLAEQKVGSAVGPAKNETGAEAAKPAEEVTEAVPGKPSKPARKGGRLVSVLRAFMFLIVISALVLSLGTVLSSTADKPAGPSQTEADRQSAWEATNSLLEQAVELGNAGNKPEVQELLAQTATDLATQGDALSDGLPTGTATATASATAPASATLEALVLGLRSNGESLLQDAVGADHAMGRVFAAVGTSQLLRSQEVAAAADLESGDSPALPASVDFPAPDAPECTSTLDPRPGATIDAALLAAAQGEQKAVYAYQVVTAQLSEPQFKLGTQLLARHEAKLASLKAELEVRCLPGTALVPGFVLDEAFTTQPTAALASLEGELAAVYADLAALSTAPSTETAGARTGSSPSHLSANATQLREMAVAWLLDSAHTQAGWRGRVGALAGMDANS